MSDLRLALLTEIPAPYRIPLFNALAERVELDVLYLREQNPKRRHYRLHENELSFRWRVLRGADLTVGQRWLVLNRGVGAALRSLEPDAVLLGGWNQPAFWSAALHARRRHLPLLVWVENTLREAGVRGPKRLLARAADAFVVPGRASEDYVRELAPTAQVTTAPNAVDGRLFASRRGDRDALRSEHGLTRTTILYVGRLSPEKGVDVLVEVARDLPADVVVAGSGPEESRLRASAPSNVRFLGDVDRDELPCWYAAADVLCLPSRRDPWGMTLNEGAAAGLALVASDAAGATQELVEDGVNGYRVAAGDPGALHRALCRLCGDDDLLAAAQRRSLEIGSTFTPARWADAVATATTALAQR